MLDHSEAEIVDERSSKRSPMSEAEAAALLRDVDEVVIARGRAMRTLSAADASVDDLRGPTGGIRAPLVRVGRRLLVGFHPETLATLLSGAG